MSDRVALLTLGDPFRVTGGFLYHRRMAELAPQFGLAIEFISLPERLFPLATMSARSILKQALTINPDVLIVDSLAAWCLAPALGSLPASTRLMGSLHQPPGGMESGPLRKPLQAWLDRRTYRRAAHLVVASDSLAIKLLRDGVTAPMTVVPPGRDHELQEDTERIDLREGRQTSVLFVGNWMRRKGLHFLLEAVSQLPAATVTLHLVGDPTSEPSYARTIRRRLARPDLSERVVVHGVLPREEVQRMYLSADVFALPSLQEPYGTAWGEAMACGLPVLGWNAGNLPFLITHGAEGFALSPGDVASLAEAIRELAEDEPLRARMGAAARQRAESFPTWRESAALYFEVIALQLGLQAQPAHS